MQATIQKKEPKKFTAPPYRYTPRERRGSGTEILPEALSGKLTLEKIRKMYSPPETLGAPQDVAIAQDSALADNGVYSLLHHTFQHVRATAFPQFLGYGVLAGLMQNQVIRSGIEMIADEMTREWIELNRVGEEDKNKSDDFDEELDALGILEKDIGELDGDREEQDEVIQALEQELRHYSVQRLFREAFAMTGYMGGCLIYIDTLGDDATPDELLSPLYLDEAVFPAGALRGFKIIEPFNVSPGYYQSNNPLRKDYFQPQTWWIQGKEVHRSRLLYFAHNIPSTLMLPAYNFFGIPLAQLVLDAVTHFTSTRESTMRALKKYSLTVFRTNLTEIGQENFLNDIQTRVQFMCDFRDNDGIEIIDNESEAIETVVSPIAGMTEVVRQAMDIVAAMFNEPAVKLWGITPSGLNSTGESDLVNHYDNIAAMQEAIFKSPLRTMLRILQWNKFQKLDDAIDFTFKPLGALNEQTRAQIQSAQSQRDSAYINIGVLSPEEVRSRLAADPDSGYSNIDVSDLPEPKQGGAGGGAPSGGAGAMPPMGGQEMPKPQEPPKLGEKIE